MHCKTTDSESKTIDQRIVNAVTVWLYGIASGQKDRLTQYAFLHDFVRFLSEFVGFLLSCIFVQKFSLARIFI